MTAESATTAGTFTTEPQAWDYFDELVVANGCFAVHREVCGEYIHPRMNTIDKTARLDRLLIPSRKALDAGWRLGAIAVEGKKSGNDLGPMIAQALDYTRCAWRLSVGNPGMILMAEWLFLYPVDCPGGSIESVMAQNRIGWCRADRQRIVFGTGGMHGLVLNEDGTMTHKPMLAGRKRGSR